MEESSKWDGFLTRPALIVDRDIGRESARDWVPTTQELAAHLQDERLSYQAVYLSADQPGISTLQCVGELRKRFPLSSIYFVYDTTTDEPLKAVELRRLGIRDLIRRHEVPEKIRERHERSRELAPRLSAAIQKRAKKVEAGASIPVPIQIPGFRPVQVEDMLGGEVSLFDVHILLPNQRRIKIFAANDAFDVNRVIKYISEGVHWVYVREASVRNCLQYTEFLSENLVRNLHVSDEIKFLHVANMGNLLLTQFFEARTPDFSGMLDEVGGVSEKIKQLLFSVRNDPTRMVRAFFRHADHLHHAFSVTWISGLLALGMKMNTPKTLERLTFASIFHDIGLLTLPENIRLGTSAIGAGEEGAGFEHHCEAGVQLLSALGVSEASILQAVAQHHQKWGEGEVHVFAELIRMSDELTWLLKNTSETDKAKVLADFRERQYNQFSLPVIEAFDRIFRSTAEIQRRE